jgi:hypothetical protein
MEDRDIYKKRTKKKGNFKLFAADGNGNFRLFAANGNGKQKFVFFGKQRINCN